MPRDQLAAAVTAEGDHDGEAAPPVTPRPDHTKSIYTRSVADPVPEQWVTVVRIVEPRGRVQTDDFTEAAKKELIINEMKITEWVRQPRDGDPSVDGTEEVTRKAHGPQADTWSLGSRAVEMGGGEPRTPGEPLVGLVPDGTSRNPELQSAEKLAPVLCDFFIRCLGVDVEKRVQQKNCYSTAS
ncbi:Serine/threonine-protein kinase PAK 2 [Fukomys damarensis]|uniref:Serine/threonine-protein kinase PAK 2 n=1 Tax=Fukomys damarensis TaxID=885580 RepID=A0A091DQJ9_FUKDA|nr:Serine/threonine-protein kinase PAK 2 [Fukomys damarensis]